MKISPNASSDVRRVRDMIVVGGALALGVIAFTVVTRFTTHGAPSNGASVGPLARPHERAGVACAACHGGDDARASCTSCHESASHASTRPGHTRMRAGGSLGCADCHRAHGEGQMVTLEPSGAYVRSGGGAELSGQLPHGAPSATVPLVPLATCARCHDLTARTDPIAVCTVGTTGDAVHRPSLCMDEHGRAGDSHRFAAWTAASEVARSTPWVSKTETSTPPWGFLGASVVSSGAALALRRRRREAKARSLPLAPSPTKRLPMIDTSTCLGCHACVDACPFDVIEVEKFVAIVARPDDCCGVVLCERACPNGSLTVVDAGDAPPLLVDQHLESVDVPGLFLAGDLTGLPLIKNALRQGAAAVDRIAHSHRTRGAHESDAVLDVVIVGAGPAGLAASLRAKELGLAYATLEQGTLASSIRAFPRHKLVYDQPLQMPGEGELWLRECTKEELLAQWARVVRKHALAIRESHRVVSIDRADESFVVRASHAGADMALRARKVIVAIGRRGSPKALPIEIAPDAESKVFYHLADARSFAGQRIVVVGLGDVALEAIIALASQPGSHVTVCHRGAGFTRGKARNVSEVKALLERKKIDVRWGTNVVAMTAKNATLRVGTELTTIPLDGLLVLIGGAPSVDLLARAGVQILSETGSYEAES